MKSNSSPKSAPQKPARPSRAKKPEQGGKGAPSGKTPGEAKEAASVDPAKSTRLGLIKARHEAIRREIDQIREDLENEEEE